VNAISLVVLLLAMLLLAGSLVLRVVRRVRFSLRDMMVMLLCGGTCVSLVVGGGHHEIQLSLGIFGLIVWVAVLIAAIGRANLPESINAAKVSNPGEPPHGPESDG
jgi:hypothetical protein